MVVVRMNAPTTRVRGCRVVVAVVYRVVETPSEAQGAKHGAEMNDDVPNAPLTFHMLPNVEVQERTADRRSAPCNAGLEGKTHVVCD